VAGGAWLVANAGAFDPVTTLPPNVYITSLIASAMLTRHRTLRAILYFWAFWPVCKR
jgi:hypothetical protein